MQTTESTAPQDQSGRQDAEAPTPEVEEAVRQRAEWARQAVPELATAGRVRKDAVLRHMAEALRAKVEEDPDNPRIVMTVRGVGYRAGST